MPPNSHVEIGPKLTSEEFRRASWLDLRVRLTNMRED
jgi:hypothetical protein